MDVQQSLAMLQDMSKVESDGREINNDPSISREEKSSQRKRSRRPEKMPCCTDEEPCVCMRVCVCVCVCVCVRVRVIVKSKRAVCFFFSFLQV